MARMVDIHCHIVPCVDDGAKDMKTALELLRMEYEDGVRSIIVTPHFRKGMFETSQEDISQQFFLLKKEVSRLYPDMHIYLGCEFHANMDMMENLKNGERPTMAGTRYVLVEFSELHRASYVRERCHALLGQGYIPIIAHAERYSLLYKNYEELQYLVDLGALIQVNASSIVGEAGFWMKCFCKNLMKKDLIHFVGSDAHNLSSRKPCLGKCFAYITKVMGKGYARRIMYANPACVIGDEMIRN